MQKRERQSIIVDLVAAGNVSSQERLVGLLTEMGISVTQASVSRDLDELGVVKVNRKYSMPEVKMAANSFGFKGVVGSGSSLLVAKCAPGLASAAAVRIDAAGIRGVSGTIAGDDTIFVAVESARHQNAVRRKLVELFDE